MTDCYLGVSRILQGGVSPRGALCFCVEPAMDPGIKNAGGHPPALAGGKPPALGGPSIRGYRYLYSRRRASGLLETFDPNLSKVILLEIAIVSKEDLLGI